MTDANPPSSPTLRNRREPSTHHHSAHGRDAEKTARELSVIYARYRQAEIKDARSFGFFWGCVTLVAVPCVFMSPFWNEFFFLLALMGVIGTMGGYTLNPAQNKKYLISQVDYYRLSGSRRFNGAHSCVFCGACGIWRKGIYKSDAIYAHCSTCKAQLFHE